MCGNCSSDRFKSGIILDKIWEGQCEGFIRNRLEAVNYAKKFIRSEEMNVQMV